MSLFDIKIYNYSIGLIFKKNIKSLKKTKRVKNRTANSGFVQVAS